MDKEILTNAVYDHIRTNESYTVLSQGLVKIGDEEWIPCITYCKYGEPDKIFTRDKSMFCQKFVLSNKY